MIYHTPDAGGIFYKKAHTTCLSAMIAWMEFPPDRLN